MIRAVFFRKGNEPAGFEIKGHATAHQNDEDGRIICAAVSSAAYMAANGITEIEHIDADISVDDGKMSLVIREGNTPGGISILKSLELHLSELEKQNDGYLTIKTEAI